MPTILMFVPPTCFTDYFKPISSVHSPYTRESLNENVFVNPVQTTQYGINFFVLFVTQVPHSGIHSGLHYQLMLNKSLPFLDFVKI